MTLKEIVKKAERDAIVETLRVHIGLGRITRVAKSLGIHRKTLYVKMREHKIDQHAESPQLTVPGTERVAG